MKIKNDFTPVKLKSFIDHRGNLSFLHLKELPFKPKRMFFVNNVPDYEKRGQHANRKDNQLLICTRGRIVLYIHDGKKSRDINLSAGYAILIPKMTWNEQTYLGSAELLSICSTEFKKNDYIRSFSTFLKLAKRK